MAFLAWQQYALTPRARGARCMGFGEYLATLGLGENGTGPAEPSVTREEALTAAERIRQADVASRRAAP